MKSHPFNFFLGLSHLVVILMVLLCNVGPYFKKTSDYIMLYKVVQTCPSSLPRHTHISTTTSGRTALNQGITFYYRVVSWRQMPAKIFLLFFLFHFFFLGYPWQVQSTKPC